MTLRPVLVPLLIDHILILLGAYLLVDGATHHRDAWTDSGGVLLLAGIAIELAVIVRSGFIAAAHGPSRGVSGSEAPSGGPLEDRWLCPGCAWKGGDVPWSLCPRCRRPLVRSVPTR